ncbi:MAG: pantoate--beta-alanine ligase [Candidatus Omnitrophica bacterium]|nr:pantoate--beta-alanine ligase [Candidatus Omnitrophota bacterium]
MKLVRSTAGIQKLIRAARRAGKSIGFVPTMGALHEGHLSLIRAARRETKLVVVSIFINPIQFDRAKDLRVYPRTLAKDARLAAKAGADVIFAPSADEMYPPGFQTYVEVTQVSRPLEGRFRSGHFRGVATVVAKLFNLVQPDAAYFGQKDAQQAALVGRMVRDLGCPLRLKVLPTVREPGGLAMSSRNTRLSTEERRSARTLFEALQSGKRLIEWGHRRENEVLRRVREVLRRAPGLKLEYIAVVDPETFERVTVVRGPVRILVAAWIGKTRLIDNCLARPNKRKKRKQQGVS